MGQQASQAVFLTFAVRKPTEISAGDLSTIADVVDAWYGATFRTHVSADCAFNSIKVTDLTTVSSPTWEQSVTDPQEGASTAAVPNNVALVVTSRTALRGRSYRGRNFVPGMPAAGLVNKTTWNASQYNAIAGDWQQLDLDFGLAGYERVVLSRQLDGVRRTTGVATVITAYVGRGRIGTQRRRVLGTGI
jgi:hypothetical protein